MNRYSLGKYISLNDLENEFGFKEKVTGKRFLLNERKPVLLGFLSEWTYGRSRGQWREGALILGSVHACLDPNNVGNLTGCFIHSHLTQRFQDSSKSHRQLVANEPKTLHLQNVQHLSMDGKKKKKFNDNRVRVINIESLLFVTHTHILYQILFEFTFNG